MRILVITQYFWPENFRINDLVSEFCELGHVVTVLTCKPNYPSGKIFPEFKFNPLAYKKFKSANVVRVPVIPRGNTKLKLLFNYISFVISATVCGVWYLRSQKFDLIFVFEPSPVTVGLPAVFFRYFKRSPVVFWALDLWPETLEAVGVVRSKLVLKIVEWIVSFIYNHCDLILAQSKSFIPQIHKYCQKRVKVKYFPSWSDVTFDFSKVAAAKEIPVVNGSFNILFAGNVGDAQDFPAILAAAEILKFNKSIRWLIVGDGRKLEWVKSEVARRNLEHCFLLFGSFPIDRMPSFFKHADTLLVSLKDEPIFSLTIPGKIQSYLAAGIPIIAMLNGETREIVSKSGAGLTCAAGDAKALASIIQKIADMDIEERINMGRSGLVFSETEFNRQIIIARLFSWINELDMV